MQNIQLATDWYKVTKEIIIPASSVISTIIIGVFIAIILKRKENKAKIKQLLIDHYMDYLDIKTKDFESNYKEFQIEVFREIKLNQDEIFANNSNWHLPIQIIDKEIAEISAQLRDSQQQNPNWSLYTYRFAFLLGKKKYFKKVLPFENIITQEITTFEKRSKLISDVVAKIKSDSDINTLLNASDTDKIYKAITKIEKLILMNYNNYEYQLFNPFNNKIADLINDF